MGVLLYDHGHPIGMARFQFLCRCIVVTAVQTYQLASQPGMANFNSHTDLVYNVELTRYRHFLCTFLTHIHPKPRYPAKLPGIRAQTMIWCGSSLLGRLRHSGSRWSSRYIHVSVESGYPIKTESNELTCSCPCDNRHVYPEGLRPRGS